MRVHDVAAAADFMLVRAALNGQLSPGRDLALGEELRYDRLETDQPEPRGAGLDGD